MTTKLRINFFIIIASLLLLISCNGEIKENKETTTKNGNDKIVIAHRGASAYLPEHTIESKILAHTIGVDYIEQDVVMTKDDKLIVMHDIYLDLNTNVTEVFPNRSREDGRFYAIDFTLSEIKKLNITERIDYKTKKPVNPTRNITILNNCKISTFKEELELIQGLNSSRKMNVGVYPEIKNPTWHKNEGKDVTVAIINVLKKYGYTNKDDKCYVQCAELSEIKRLKTEIKTNLKLIQLIGATPEYDSLKTEEGIKELATYVDGIGPYMSNVIVNENNNTFSITPLVNYAHKYNLVVHPYTLNEDTLPSYSKSFDDLLRIFFEDVQVDGIFTDYPDIAVNYLENNSF